MSLTVSSKYQVVIPKEVRKKLSVKPGQKMIVKKFSATEITLSLLPSPREFFDKHAGSLKNTPWQKEGLDAAAWLRRERDKDD